MIDDPSLAKIIDAVLALAVSIVSWLIISSKDKMDQVMTRLTKVESEKISEDKAREIISIELADIKETLHKIADTVVEIRVDQAKRSND
jgi:hypothetical protein